MLMFSTDDDDDDDDKRKEQVELVVVDRIEQLEVFQSIYQTKSILASAVSK